ncbi:interleukin-5 receptor subunit alpha-like isoform X1, partial [Clarias magur]
DQTILTPQFNMRLCGLLLALSLVLAEDDICSDQNKCTPERQTNDLVNHKNSNISINPFDIPCIIVHANVLSCSWSIDGVPDDVQYSASFRISEEHSLNCISEASKKLVECQSQLWGDDSEDTIVVKVNVSMDGYWCIICQNYDPVEIEKLDPPQNITTLIKSTNLEIQWVEPRSLNFDNPWCFEYELKINDELISLVDKLEYNITNFEPTTKYTIKMRVRQGSNCGGTDTSPWSDWSQPVEINPSNQPGSQEVNIGVIAAIAFVLPMVLLAILLICKFQRLFEKVFPSIPNPSKNVQMLLEKNDFNQ